VGVGLPVVAHATPINSVGIRLSPLVARALSKGTRSVTVTGARCTNPVRGLVVVVRQSPMATPFSSIKAAARPHSVSTLSVTARTQSVVTIWLN
jgi:C4-dicarboxylate transporter